MARVVKRYLVVFSRMTRGNIHSSVSVPVESYERDKGKIIELAAEKLGGRADMFMSTLGVMHVQVWDSTQEEHARWCACIRDTNYILRTGAMLNGNA